VRACEGQDFLGRLDSSARCSMWLVRLLAISMCLDRLTISMLCIAIIRGPGRELVWPADRGWPADSLSFGDLVYDRTESYIGTVAT
jgi:hypothetical protein